MVDKPEPMDAEQIKAALAAQITDATDFIDTVVAPEREKATKYYLAEPFGDERKGRSQVISTDVRDTVRSIMPNLLRIFFSSERYVSFTPRGPEDEAVAEQATDYVNHILQNDNPGYEILYAAFKDAMVRKAGVVKWWWDEAEEVTSEEYKDLDLETAQVILADPTIDEKEVAIDADEVAEGDQPSIDIRITRRAEAEQVRVAAVPVEEFLIDRDARSIPEASFVAHRRELPIWKLVALGYDFDQLAGLGGDDSLGQNGEAAARRIDGQGMGEPAQQDPSLRLVLVHECYVRMDQDGDGYAELRRIVVGGGGHEILEREGEPDNRIVPEIPFAVFSVDPEPHTFFGQSIADFTMDIQRTKSAVQREMFDNLTLANNPATGVVEGQVNISDVLSDEVGRIIRMRQPGMVMPLGVPFIAGQSFPILEYLDTLKESRTGVTKASMGLDADALQSTTRAAVSATISASQGQIEMLARNFAETGMKRLMLGILGLVQRHQDKQRVIRLRGEWVAMDPRSWNRSMDLCVNTALGRGTEEERLGALMGIAQKQELILNGMGPQNPFVTPQQYYNTLAAMTELVGFKDVSRFWSDPSKAPPQPPQQPQQDPQLALAQQQLQIEQQKAQGQLQIAQAKAQADAQLKAQQQQADAALELQKHQQQLQMDREKLLADMQAEREKLALEMQLEREKTAAEIRLAREKALAELELAREAQRMDVAAGIAKHAVELGGEIG